MSMGYMWDCLPIAGDRVLRSDLRVRSLEIVDSQGRVRGQLIVEPGGEQDGRPYPETVVFRLMNPDGNPGVKLTSSAESQGLRLSRTRATQQGWSGVQILSEEPGGSVRLVGQDGAEEIVRPWGSLE